MRGVAAAVVIFGALAIGCSSRSRPTAASSLHSTVYGYSIAVPAGWSTLSATTTLETGSAPVLNSTATDVLAAHADRRIRSLTTPALVIGAAPVNDSMSLDTWRAQVVTLVATFKGCAEPTTTDATTVGGAPGEVLTYRNCPAGSGLYHVWTVTRHGGFAFQIVWFDQQNRQAADESLLKNEIASLRFDH